jgi:methylenetetrahydrofolate dehydrogenase (NADP+)/methenyltetrahydrofolate cyclohydrolase
MQILDGKQKSQEILSSLKSEIEKNKLNPVLDMILVGDNPSSIKYTEMKQSTGKSIGIGGNIHHLPKTATETEIIDLINKLNNDPNITAVMVQLPLPDGLNTDKIINTIDPAKDADGLTAINLGRLFQKDKNVLVSATPLGIIKLFEMYDIDLSGKNAVIINRSPFIGLSLAALFTNHDATVTICHSKTKNIKELCQNADIIVSGTGQPNYLTADFVREGAIVIDIGLEVDFKNVKNKCSFITPPTGGVGPMTVASLLANTVKIALSK